MVEVKGATSIQEIEQKHVNGDFLAEHYPDKPPYHAVEATEESILKIDKENEDLTLRWY
jgi:hypothetical protein